MEVYIKCLDVGVLSQCHYIYILNKLQTPTHLHTHTQTHTHTYAHTHTHGATDG